MFHVEHFLLLNLNHALASAGLDIIHPRDDLAGKVVERLGVGRVFSFEHGGLAAVSGFANVGIELNISEKGNSRIASPSFLRRRERRYQFRDWQCGQTK